MLQHMVHHITQASSAGMHEPVQHTGRCIYEPIQPVQQNQGAIRVAALGCANYLLRPRSSLQGVPPALIIFCVSGIVGWFF